MHQVIIVGSGPAGYTAAIYAARANLAPLLIASSLEWGGDLMKTTEVENFPGFPGGIAGPDLMEKMQAQAQRFGTDIRLEDVAHLDLAGDVKRVLLADDTMHTAHTVILATGSAYRTLGLDDEVRLSGRGVSWCATCDGAFFRDKTVAVVGGGDSALEEATFLTRFATKVFVVHRRDRLRASAAMQDRATSSPRIEFVWNTRVDRIFGEDRVTGIGLVDTVTKTPSKLGVDGIFVAIGSDPRTGLVRGQVELAPDGTIAVDGRSSRTSVPGVFAAGDVADPTYRQAITAAGSGTMAAIDAEHYLASRSVHPPRAVA